MPCNIDAHHKGYRIVALDTGHRRFATDFPGWDAPDCGEFLLPIPPG